MEAAIASYDDMSIAEQEDVKRKIAQLGSAFETAQLKQSWKPVKPLLEVGKAAYDYSRREAKTSYDEAVTALRKKTKPRRRRVDTVMYTDTNDFLAAVKTITRLVSCGLRDAYTVFLQPE